MEKKRNLDQKSPFFKKKREIAIKVGLIIVYIDKGEKHERFENIIRGTRKIFVQRLDT